MWQGGEEDIKGGGGGLQKFLDTRKGGSEKIREGLWKFVYFKTDRRGGGGLLKNWTASEGGCSNFKLWVSIPSFPPCHIMNFP